MILHSGLMGTIYNNTKHKKLSAMEETQGEERGRARHGLTVNCLAKATSVAGLKEKNKNHLSRNSECIYCFLEMLCFCTSSFSPFYVSDAFRNHNQESVEALHLSYLEFDVSNFSVL